MKRQQQTLPCAHPLAFIAPAPPYTPTQPALQLACLVSKTTPPLLEKEGTEVIP